MAHENEATGDISYCQSLLSKEPASLRPSSRPSKPPRVTVLRYKNELHRLQTLCILGSISGETAHVAAEEERIRIKRLHKNLANSSLDVKVFTDKKTGLNDLVPAEILNEQKEKQAKEKQFRMNVKAKKRFNLRNVRRTLVVTLSHMKKSLKMLGPLGEEKDHNKRCKAGQERFERMKSMRTEEINKLHNQNLKITQRAEDQRRETMEKFTALKSRLGKEGSSLKRKLEEISKEGEEQEQEHKAKMLELNDKWTVRLSKLATEARLLMKLSNERQLLKKLDDKHADKKSPMKWPPEEGTLYDLKIERMVKKTKEKYALVMKELRWKNEGIMQQLLRKLD